MLKIHKLFFRSFLLVFLLTVFTITFVVYFWAKSLYLKEIKINLSQNIDAFLVLFDKNSMSDAKNIINNLGEKLNLRVSLIDENGYLIADSEDFELYENHLNRQEIKEAKNGSFSSSLRFSKSLKKEQLYVAKMFKLEDKSYFIRMSDFTNKIFENFKKLILEILLYILLF